MLAILLGNRPPMASDRWSRQLEASRASILSRQEAEVVGLKREQWTESEVAALPRGEHDIFERKSGRLLDDQEFRAKMAKAMSAMANSGGGHIVVGVEDDGAFTGVPPTRGRTSTREWLEQTLPGLVAFPLHGVRLHEVIPATPTAIPPGLVVLVVDVGDSSLAPHQSTVDQRYYYRVAGHSKPAPHFYIETLRNRLTKPTLEAELSAIERADAYPWHEGVFVELRLNCVVTNAGRIAAYRWHLHLDGTDGDAPGRGADIWFDEHRFPRRRSRDNLVIPGDPTLLPSLASKVDLPLGIFLRASQHEPEAVKADLRTMLNPDFHVRLRVITETSPGEPARRAVGGALDVEKVLARLFPLSTL